MWWTEIVWWKCQCSDSKGNQLVCSFGITILVSFVEKGSTTCFSFTKVLSDTFMNPLETSVLAWFVCLHIWFCMHNYHLPKFPVHCHPLSPSFFFSVSSLTSCSTCFYWCDSVQRASLVAVSIATIQEPTVSSLKSHLASGTRPWCLDPFASPATPPCWLLRSTNIKWKADICCCSMPTIIVLEEAAELLRRMVNTVSTC